MSVKVMARIWAQSSRKDGELLLLLALADSSDDDGLSFPDIDDLAHKSRLSTEEAKEKLEDLARRGVLRKIENMGGQDCNYFQIIEVQRVR